MWSRSSTFLCPDGYLKHMLNQAVARALQSASKPEAKLLDLGCGDRPYEQLVLRSGYSYTASDIGENRRATVELIENQTTELADQSFDVILSTQVLEHVWNIDWYLSECHRLLADSGTLVLSTHGHWPYHPHPTDFRRWTRDGLVRDIETRGFVIERVDDLLGPTVWPLMFLVLAIDKVGRQVPILNVLLKLIWVFTNIGFALLDAVTPSILIRNDAAIYLIVAKPKRK